MPIQLHDHDTHLHVHFADDSNVVKETPAHVYLLKVHASMSKTDIMLVKDRERFTVIEKKYGRHNEDMEVVLEEYDRHNPPLGVLLYGMKGSGKSMFSEDLCNHLMAEHKLPVVRITDAQPLSIIATVLAATGPAVVYFDEFGKVYDEDERETLLPLFSDTNLQGCVFVVTGNSKKEFSEYMIDRPGRFLFRLNYSGVPKSAAFEMSKEAMLTTAQTRMVLQYVTGREVSFDQVGKLVNILRRLGTDDVNKIAHRMEIINLPTLNHRAVTLDRLRYKGKDVIPATVKELKYNEGHLSFKLLLDEGTVCFNQQMEQFGSVEISQFKDTYPAMLPLLPSLYTYNDALFDIGVSDQISTGMFHYGDESIRSRLEVPVVEEEEEEVSSEGAGNFSERQGRAHSLG